ncbi:MAG: hypothetical protein ACLTCP_12205 [Ruminococcus bicirculans (ex Wegman et al. 2014)]
MSEYNEQRAAFDKAVKTFDGNNSFAAPCFASFGRKLYLLIVR